MKKTSNWALLLIAGVASLFSVAGQAAGRQNLPAPSPPAQPAQVMDGGAGPCSLDLSVLDDGKPVAAANVKVHIAYGFAGIRRLDLEAYTGNDGKLKFTGLPARVHRPPLEFRVSKDQLTGIAVYNPDEECHAHHDITLAKRQDRQK